MVIIYESRGTAREWKMIRKALKEAGIRKVKTSVWLDEVTGGLLNDPRDFKGHGAPDRRVYTIRVEATDEDIAAAIVRRVAPDYKPYKRRMDPDGAGRQEASARKKKNRTYLIFTLILFLAVCAASVAYFAMYGRYAASKDSLRKYHFKTSEIANFDEVDEKCKETQYKDFTDAFRNGTVKRVYAEFSGSEDADTMYYTVSGKKVLYLTQNPDSEGFKEKLLNAGVLVYPKADVFNFEQDKINTAPKKKSMVNTASIILDIVMLGGLAVFMILIMRSISGKTGLRGESGRQDDTPQAAKKTFDDIGGLQPLKEDLRTVVDFLSEPRKYEEAGADLPKGILLVGPPGTGKTLIAQVMANEAHVGFIYANASDFVEKYVGVGASRIRDMFRKARKKAPCIVFIDEVDTLCVKRGNDMNSEDRKALTALLTEMDGFRKDENILVIGATNRIEDIDTAALRPGRFTDIYTVPLPETTKERMEIIDIYMKGKKFADDFRRQDFAREMMGRSPAEIKDILNEAAIISVQKRLGSIDRACVEEAVYKRLMHGHQRDNAETDPDDLRLIAYHESGHVLIARLTGARVSKVTIIPSTNGAGGVTFIDPPQRKLYTKKMMENEVMQLYAGKVSEYLVSGRDWDKTTQGCSNDIEKATYILKDMVDAYGMSDNALVNMNVLNQKTGEKSAEYIVELSAKLRDQTVRLMESNKAQLDALARELLKSETLYEEQIDSIIFTKESAPAGLS